MADYEDSNGVDEFMENLSRRINQWHDDYPDGCEPFDLGDDED